MFFFTCNSAFEQGHLEPWRYKNAFIIIIIIIIIMYLDRRNMQKVELCRMRYLAINNYCIFYDFGFLVVIIYLLICMCFLFTFYSFLYLLFLIFIFLYHYL